MANAEHVKLLKQGVEVWNRWRRENKGVNLDLSRADFRKTNLAYAQFWGADLWGTNLEKTILSWARLDMGILVGAKLKEANLSGANLSGADLSGADLSGADLSGARLDGAILNGTKLNEANLYEATIYKTIFVDVDLHNVHGLDTLRHVGRSAIGIDTLYKSGGDIPESFLRGCGVPDSMIEYARSLVVAERPIDYYSVFISYSSKDEALAKRLHADLQAQGVRCWFAPHDLPIGARIRVGIDEAIRLHDKLLLILSRHSVQSDWVEKEVETAMEQERRQKRTVLFPIRCDTAVMKIDSGWPADVRRGRNIGDFCKWKDHDAYQQAFARLLRDLKAGKGDTERK